jgi:predicted DNA-binding transcriptional regulator YafY
MHQADEGPEAAAERRWLPVALEAIRRHRELRIIYQKPTANEPEERAVQPLHLAHLDHLWTLVAHDPLRNEVRNFLLFRIKSARATSRTFKPPADFDPKKELAGSIGRFTGTEVIEVRIAFDKVVAPYIRERPWHPSQIIAVERADGAVEVTLQLNNLIDVQRRILACGSHAEALAPSGLRDAVRREVAGMHELYEKPSGSCSQGHSVSPSA